MTLSRASLQTSSCCFLSPSSPTAPLAAAPAGFGPRFGDKVLSPFGFQGFPGTPCSGLGVQWLCHLDSAGDLSGSVTRHRGSWATTGWGQSCPRRAAQTCPTPCLAAGMRLSRCHLEKGTLLSPSPASSHLPSTQRSCQGRASPNWAQSPGAVPGPVRVSVCVPGLSVCATCSQLAPFYPCFFPPQKTALKGSTAAPGHSWSPWATSGGGISHPEGSWSGQGRHGRESPLTCAPFLPCVPQMSESETLITMVNRMVETSSPRAQLYMQVRLRPPGPAWLVPGGRATRGHLLPPGVTRCHPGSPPAIATHAAAAASRHISLSGERAAPSQALL